MHKPLHRYTILYMLFWPKQSTEHTTRYVVMKCECRSAAPHQQQSSLGLNTIKTKKKSFRPKTYTEQRTWCTQIINTIYECVRSFERCFFLSVWVGRRRCSLCQMGEKWVGGGNMIQPRYMGERLQVAQSRVDCGWLYQVISACA